MPAHALPAHDEVHWDLLATARRIIRARWKILLCTLLGGLLGVAWAVTRHPYYTSSAVFLPPHNTDLAGGASLSSIVSGEGSDVYLGMLTSRSVADDVIDHLGLMKEFGTATRTDTRTALANASSFFVSKNAMINVTVTSGKPELAAAIANEYLESLFRLNGQMVSSGYGYRRIFFEGQLDQQKKVLDEAEAALKQTQESTGVLLPQGEAQAGLNATVTLQAQIGAAEASLAALLTGSTEQNPEVIRARSQLAQLRSQLAAQLASAPRGQGIASNGRLPELSLEYTQKARAVRLNEAEYDALVQRFDSARLASIDPGPQLQIVDRAIVPERKAGPSRRNITAVGLLLGFVLGFAWVLLVNPLRRLFHLPPRARTSTQILTAVSPSSPPATLASPPEYDLARRPWLTAFLVLVATLASTIRLKFSVIQYLEIVYFFQIVAVLALFVRRNYRTSWHRTFIYLGAGFILFCIVGIVLAFYSLRFHFAYPHTIPALTEPVVIAFVRSVELLLSVFPMLWLADLFRKDPAALRFTLRLYFWTGVLSAFYALLTWPLVALGLGEFGVLAVDHRFRGFYNEGGPYGLYVLSVLLLGIVLYRTAWERPRRILWAMPLVAFSLFMSASKAAIMATATLLLLNSLFVGSLRRRLTVVSALGVLMLVAAETVNLPVVINGLMSVADTYERGSALHPNDGNYVIGRAAGLFIVPRMVAAHPLSGVGWGNYGLLRNLPEYRGASAFAFENDQPELGLLGNAAELGVPLDLFLLFLLFLPFLLLRRLRCPLYLTNLALLQPLVHLWGAQLNLTYPWVVTAFALGLAYSDKVPLATPLKKLKPFRRNDVIVGVCSCSPPSSSPAVPAS